MLSIQDSKVMIEVIQSGISHNSMVGPLSHVVVGSDWPLQLRLCFALSLTEEASSLLLPSLITYY